MQRARGPWWAALPLLAPLVVAGCDHDEGDTASASGGVGEDGSVGDSNVGDPVPITCDELRCADDELCVEPRPYCDLSGEEPELRHEPAYCRPMDALPPRGAVDGEAGGGVEVGLCDDLRTEGVYGPDGERLRGCAEVEIPCG